MSSDRRRKRGGRRGTSFCSNCGDALAPSMNFCPNCGTPNGRGATRSQLSKASRSSGATASAASADAGVDRDVLEYRIAAAAQEGWELEHDFGDHAVMVRRTFGGATDHLLVALVTVWWTMGVGNALYGAYRYFEGAERMVLRADHVAGENGGSRRETVARIAAGLCLVTAATLAAASLLVAGGAASVVLLALAVGFGAAGVGLYPGVRRRLSERRPVTTNGRRRSVDERAVVAPDEPCAACADPIGPGLERTYRKEFCVLGVPLSTSEGRNYYCRRCANAEPFVASTAEADEAGETDEFAAGGRTTSSDRTRS